MGVNFMTFDYILQIFVTLSVYNTLIIWYNNFVNLKLKSGVTYEN